MMRPMNWGRIIAATFAFTLIIAAIIAAAAMNSAEPLEYWLHRYQTMLTGLLAVATGLLVYSAAVAQIKQSQQQARESRERGYLMHNLSTAKTLLAYARKLKHHTYVRNALLKAVADWRAGANYTPGEFDVEFLKPTTVPDGVYVSQIRVAGACYYAAERTTHTQDLGEKITEYLENSPNASDARSMPPELLKLLNRFNMESAIIALYSVFIDENAHLLKTCRAEDPATVFLPAEYVGEVAQLHSVSREDLEEWLSNMIPVTDPGLDE